jgi:hypothetical protein
MSKISFLEKVRNYKVVKFVEEKFLIAKEKVLTTDLWFGIFIFVICFILNALFNLFNSNSTENSNFEFEAVFVGIATLILFRKQMKDQQALSNRIADLQYCKMMEEKLLGIVYAVRSSSIDKNGHIFTVHSAQDFDFIKFHFARGFLLRGFATQNDIATENNFSSISEYFEQTAKSLCESFVRDNYTQEQKQKLIPHLTKSIKQYCENYSQMIASIKTKEIKEYYEDSRFQEVFKIFQKEEVKKLIFSPQ